jgi:epoxide hydrolase-like predicted phosphatase
MKKMAILALTVWSTLWAVPEAVVFDFGGVMTGMPRRELVVDFIRDSFGLSAEEWWDAAELRDEALDRGLTDEQFWVEYAQQRGVQLPENWVADFRNTLLQAIGVSDSMYALVEELKEQGVRVGMLSNIDTRLAGMVRNLGLYEPFDPCLLSCEIGVNKPDPRAYQILLETLELEGNLVVFVDDKPENVTAAQTLGIDALLFESEAGFREELARRGVMELVET